MGAKIETKKIEEIIKRLAENPTVTAMMPGQPKTAEEWVFSGYDSDGMLFITTDINGVTVSRFISREKMKGALLKTFKGGFSIGGDPPEFTFSYQAKIAGSRIVIGERELVHLLSGGEIEKDGSRVILDDIGFGAVCRMSQHVSTSGSPVGLGQSMRAGSKEIVGVAFGDRGVVTDANGIICERCVWANLETGRVLLRPIEKSARLEIRDRQAPLKFVESETIMDTQNHPTI